jgi:hypothetical protein
MAATKLSMAETSISAKLGLCYIFLADFLGPKDLALTFNCVIFAMSSESMPA